MLLKASNAWKPRPISCICQQARHILCARALTCRLRRVDAATLFSFSHRAASRSSLRPAIGPERAFVTDKSKLVADFCQADFKARNETAAIRSLARTT